MSMLNRRTISLLFSIPFRQSHSSSSSPLRVLAPTLVHHKYSRFFTTPSSDKTHSSVRTEAKQAAAATIVPKEPSTMHRQPTAASEEAPVVFRDSSSVIIAAPIPKSQCKPGKANYKILLLQRNKLGAAPGAHVFPGGNVDKADHDPQWATMLNRPTQVPAGSPSLHNQICAIREAFEESGVLITNPPTAFSDEQVKHWRDTVHHNAPEFMNLCKTHNVVPAIENLVHFSSWVTPPMESRRFRTQFFLAVLPWSRDSFSESRIFADGKETTRLDWFTPEEALEAYKNREDPKLGIRTMLPPQFVTLSQLLPIKRHEDLLNAFRGREIVDTMPEFLVTNPEGPNGSVLLSGILPWDEEHSKHVKKGHRHRVQIRRSKRGMDILSYIQGDVEVKARL